ncbi:phosphatidylinositol 3 and 4-kinase-domain-containing protein [Sphaerosporella brunnea]|uniref:Phosphatidylinositol 4-kinase n=1 Tax=Sphaerosporella brunnea TaxID=1250544 RepID=A0A5J5EP76_9PEZI|nr:phosphatidylinositol 3 and 4-kinase-domain-containing protein [Sphaerosporella brunnea]
MPRRGPPASGYERIAQEADLSDSDEDESSYLVAQHAPRIVSVQPQHAESSHNGAASSSHAPRHGTRRRSNSAVDIKVINARLEKWADQIANKFKFKKDRGHHGHPPLEILHSVFVAPESYRSYADVELPEVAEEAHMTPEQFDEIVESVRTAISKGIDPKLIKQGSSGSYFMRDSNGRIVAVFKPKDEEPYGKLNPKIMKWLHRTLFPCFFGRACLIPNLSYISEAAACVLDRQLKTYMVPYTDIVHLSSKAFHYDYWDRRAFYRRHKPLPPKVGSFQVFLQGFQDANIFLRKHPWPDPYSTGFRTDAMPKRRAPWDYACRPSGDDEEEEDDLESGGTSPLPDGTGRKFVWTEQLKQNFREELEKLVILDYIMRNTDRGLDNWMIKVDPETQEVAVTSKPLGMNLEPPATPLSRPASTTPSKCSASPVYRVQEPMMASRSSTPQQATGKIRIGAIDNSLAFPWKHPDQWRSFPFGWLFLPVSLIGQPFSQRTRDHFIPLLTSPKWWSETQTKLRRLFEQDSDFKERMFQKQMAVLKGQAFNVLETLKTPDQGPLELTRRARMHVWDDEMEVPVAVPLRMPSSEERRRNEIDLERGLLDDGEMDIGALVSSAPTAQPPPDLLGFSPPRSQLPSDRRLGATAHSSPAAERRAGGVEDEFDVINSAAHSIKSEPRSDGRPQHRGRASYDSGMISNGTRSNRPWDPRRGRNSSAGAGFPTNLYNDEDDEGDLGYSAVTGSEGARRKVIAERLEAVKSRNPVFTWC